MSECPYCRKRERNSDDHIFPDFLGGKRTIRTCKECNDTFGHSVEGLASADLVPLVIVLRSAGLAAPRTVVWRQAFRDADTGVQYDIDSNLEARASRPIVEKDESGNIKAAYYHDDRMTRQFVAKFERRGRRVVVTDRPERKVPFPLLNFRVTMGTELRRLAVKMAVATADYFGNTEILDAQGRTFLSGEGVEAPCTIRDVSVHPELEEFRSPLCHLVYVEGNAQNRSCYAVVQFYGLLQLYLLLNAATYTQRDFAAIATLSPTGGYEERFEAVPPRRLSRPPQYNVFEPGVKIWEERFNNEARTAFGDKAFTMIMQDVRPPSTPRWSVTSNTTELTTFLPTASNKKDK
jgi:hypothetical protein